MVVWHHWLNGHEFEWPPGDSARQGSLACCSPWGHKGLDITEWLNWTDAKQWYSVVLSSFISSVQFSCLQSLSCAWLLWPQGLQYARFSVHHQLQELAQTHVHWVDDAIKPSHPLSPTSPPAFNLSQHQGLLMSQFFPSGGQSIGVSVSASVLPMNISDWFP